MKKLSYKVMFLVVLSFVMHSVVSAQATRTWVSGVGDDVNPCSRTAPCKTFAGAISKTATNGEINCLDPGGFGAVTITKSITIECSGTFGSILASGTNGVVINITAAADSKKSVRLRGLRFNGASTGINGIRILAANSVSVEDTVIDGFTTHGISVETTVGTPKVVVSNTTVRNNNGNGINTFITGGTVTLTVSGSLISNTAAGLNLSSNTKAVITDSILTANGTGLAAFQSEMGVQNCGISGNTTGVSAQAGGTIRISGNMITTNTTGLAVAAGGSIISSANNVIQGNTTNGSPTATVALN